MEPDIVGLAGLEPTKYPFVLNNLWKKKKVPKKYKINDVKEVSGYEPHKRDYVLCSIPRVALPMI